MAGTWRQARRSRTTFPPTLSRLPVAGRSTSPAGRRANAASLRPKKNPEKPLAAIKKQSRGEQRNATAAERELLRPRLVSHRLRMQHLAAGRLGVIRPPQMEDDPVRLSRGFRYFLDRKSTRLN